MASTIPKRQPYLHEGRAVYEWEQTLDEIRIFFRPPPGVTAKMLDITISVSSLKVGIRGNPPFLHENFSHQCIVKDSTWLMEDGEVEVLLTKMRKGEMWESVFEGHKPLDPLAVAEINKQMVLQRFGEEHPEFDFSGAELTGQAPDPRTFMGGMKYT